MNDDQILKLERVMPAAPDSVFSAWTDPEVLARWWGPEHMSIPHHEMDIREGGSWLTTMRSPDGNEFTVSGIYRTIDPPKRLVFTWAWHNDGVRSEDETEVTVDFAPVEGGTRLVLTQQQFATADARSSHLGGWESTFVCLEAELQRQHA